MNRNTFAALAAALLMMIAPARADDLPVFRKDMVILFQGDSITDGGRQRTGQDFNHIMGQDYAYMIAGQVCLQFPGRNLTFVNRGISGNTVRDLAGRWQTDALDLHPDLLSILVGINDTLTPGETAEEFEKTYDTLLAATLAASPNLKIVLGQPMLLPVGRYKDSYPTVLAEVKARQLAVQRLGVKYHLPVIRYQDAFDAALKLAPAEYWSWDGVHPTYARHALMAQEWLKVVTANWPHG